MRGARKTVGEAADAVGGAAQAAVGYVDPLVRDEKLRERLAAAILAGFAVQSRVRKQTGLTGLAQRLATDRALHAQLAEMAVAMQAVQTRVKKVHNKHRVRNALLFVSGIGMIIAAVPSLRSKMPSLLGGGYDQWPPSGWNQPRATTINEEIEVEVPVSTAYNQWTQFEEFPRFMDGVDEVRQLDDTLLHWAATVAGKHAEWDAKIIEQESDRLITWESTDGKYTRGSVSFEEAGSGRSRIRLQMTYSRDGVTEKIGSAVGLDNRRVRGDLMRFRELIESRRDESGAWRGEVSAGEKTSNGSTG
jgi:uncharacterized membrane protein